MSHPETALDSTAAKSALAAASSPPVSTTIQRPGPIPSGSTVNRKNWSLPWKHHESFARTTELFPYLIVQNQEGHVRELENKPISMDSVSFTGATGKSLTLETLLHRRDTEALMVLHGGKVAYEYVAPDVKPDQNRWTLSLCRTLTGIVAGKLVENGVLEINATVESVIPELSTSGYAGATVRQLLDMRSGLKVSILKILWAGGLFASGPFPAPRGVHEFITRRAKRKTGHGGPFVYRSLDTEVLGWMCERASGKRLVDLVSEIIWRPMGAEKPAEWLVDGCDDPLSGSGLCTNLRDLGRFGLVMAEDGKPGARQILAQGWMNDTRTADTETRAAFGGKFLKLPMPDGMYRNQTWVVDADRGITLCYGAFGQMLYIDPTRDTVCVLLSSWGAAQHAVAGDWLKAFQGIGDRCNRGAIAQPEQSGTPA